MKRKGGEVYNGGKERNILPAMKVIGFTPLCEYGKAKFPLPTRG